MRLIQLLTSSVAEPVRLRSALAPGDNKQKFASKEALRFVKKKNVNEKKQILKRVMFDICQALSIFRILHLLWMKPEPPSNFVSAMLIL